MLGKRWLRGPCNFVLTSRSQRLITLSLAFLINRELLGIQLPNKNKERKKNHQFNKIFLNSNFQRSLTSKLIECLCFCISIKLN